MKRRDLIKTGFLAALGSSALTGCNKSQVASSDEIIPKQTDTFQFSVPLPMNFDTINELNALNKTLKKSKVTMFYNSFPLPLSPFDGFVQIDRGQNPAVTSFDQYMACVDYAYSLGFDYCHLMNSTKALSKEDFESLKPRFYAALDRLLEHNVKEIKVTNPQIATWISEYTDKFSFSSSTATGYYSIMQYQNLVNSYPNFKLFDICIDQNQNFKFLKALRDQFPKIKLELMVNEPCIKGCPARVSHEGDVFFCVYNCQKPRDRDGAITAFFKTSAIFPWNLEYYSAIGINNFKFLPEKNLGLRANYNNLTLLKNYLKIVEEGIGDMSADDFFNNAYSGHLEGLIDKNVKLSDVLPHFPAIEHFIKHGDKCMVDCHNSCKYCHICGDKVEKMLRGA